MNVAESGDQPATILPSIQQRARTAPQACAVRCGETRCTYGELDTVADCVASALCRRAPDGLAMAGVLAHRSASTVAEVLGCLKAGWAALPLDPSRPPPEIWNTLQAAGASCCLSSEPVTDASAWPVPVLHEATCAPGEAPPAEIGPDTISLYTRTTGTTGEPVLFRLSHRALLFHASNYVQALQLTSSDRMALVIPPHAGAAVSIVCGTLLAGGTLCIADPVQEGYAGFAAWLQRERITAAYFTASLFRSFVGAVGPDLFLPDLRVLKLGGESVEATDLEAFRAITGPEAVLVNGLGITDVGGNVCFMRFGRGAAAPDGPLPVGHPVRGLDVRIVDDEGLDSRIGEIIVHGPYLAESVGSDAGRAGLDEVRTGDIGVRLPGGAIQWLGRTNDIVKIRGQRVFPAATDQVLRAMPGVRDAATVAIVDAGGTQRLVAFVEGEGSESDLLGCVSTALTGPQIPSRIFVRESLPRGANGKIDAQELRQRAEVQASPTPPEYRPEDPLERQLHDVWCAILRRDNVDRDAPFATLGGDSLAAAEMLTRVSRITGAHLPLTALYEAPTLALLCECILQSTVRGSWDVVVELTSERSPVTVIEGLVHRPPYHHVDLVGGRTSPFAGARRDDLRRSRDSRYRHAPRPFICIPGAGSDVESLRELADRVGRDRTFVALRMPGSDGTTWPPDTMDGIMETFLPAIRRYQPHGPYLLGGSSFGGVVAYELACRLSAMGDAVGAVVLLDTYAQDYPRPQAGLSFLNRMRVHRRLLLPLGNKEDWNRANVRAGMRELRNRVVARAAKHTGRQPHSFSAELRYVCLIDAALRAHRRYRPTRYAGRVDLFRCDASPGNAFEDDPTLGWGDIVGEDLVVHSIPGRHGQHIQPPFVDDLADQLLVCLRRAEGEGEPARGGAHPTAAPLRAEDGSPAV